MALHIVGGLAFCYARPGASRVSARADRRRRSIWLMEKGKRFGRALPSQVILCFVYMAPLLVARDELTTGSFGLLYPR